MNHYDAKCDYCRARGYYCGFACHDELVRIHDESMPIGNPIISDLVKENLRLKAILRDLDKNGHVPRRVWRNP